MNTIELVTNVKKQVILTENLAKLVTTLLEEPFLKWGLHFIGLIKPTSRFLSNWYILITTDMQESGWKPQYSSLTLLW
jgi:hypothetical protein